MNSSVNESYTYEYFTQDYVCRICWNEAGDTELTSFINEKDDNPLPIAEKMWELIGINVTLGFPTKICQKCLDKLKEFISFKDFCLKNEEKLTEILQKGPTELLLAEDSLNDSNFELIEEDTGSLELLGEKKNTKHSCIYCKKEYSTKIVLINHYNKIHGLTFDNLLEEKIIKKKYKSPTYCTICKEEFSTEKKMADHNSEAHHILNGYYQCFGCEKKYELRYQRFRHEKFYCKTLKQGFFCKKCDRLLPSRKIWQQHFIAHKNNKKILVPENLFKCRLCENAFKNMQLLNEHRKCHVKKKKSDNKYICDECGREFARRDYFNKHQNIHSGVKPHKCPHCDFRAGQKSTLNCHLRKHTGERPYACDMCDMKFSTSSNMIKHVRTHLGLKQFECKLCDKNFSYKQSLEEHQGAIHNQALYSCEHCPTSSYVSFRGLKRHLAQKHDKKIDKKSFKQRNNGCMTVEQKVVGSIPNSITDTPIF